jgi:hypothetical protein
MYESEYARQAQKLCRLGATNADLADFFGVSLSTISSWQVRYPDFMRACKIGKNATDERVERAIAMRAQGYWIDTEKVFCHKVKDKDGNEVVEVTRVPTKEYIVPSDVAGLRWMQCRRPAEWRDKPQEIEQQVGGGAPFEFSIKIGTAGPGPDGSRPAEIDCAPTLALPEAREGNLLPDGREREPIKVFPD